MTAIPLKDFFIALLLGAVGFAIGFYAGFFLILSIWGLEFQGFWFPVVTGLFGSGLAGVAMMPTVPEGQRSKPVATALGLGTIMAFVMAALDTDAGAMAIGGLLLVIVTSFVVHVFLTNGAPGEAA